MKGLSKGFQFFLRKVNVLAFLLLGITPTIFGCAVTCDPTQCSSINFSGALTYTAAQNANNLGGQGQSISYGPLGCLASQAISAGTGIYTSIEGYAGIDILPSQYASGYSTAWVGNCLAIGDQSAPNAIYFYANACSNPTLIGSTVTTPGQPNEMYAACPNTSDGSSLVIVAEGSQGITVAGVNAAGTSVFLAGTLNDSNSNNVMGVSWSPAIPGTPNNYYIAILNGNNLISVYSYTYNPTTPTASTFTFITSIAPSNANMKTLRWIPNQTAPYFISVGTSADVSVYSFDGSALNAAGSQALSGGVVAIDWSLDGGYVVISSGSNTANIYNVQFAGSTASFTLNTIATPSVGDIVWLAWSPDCSGIAFLGNMGGGTLQSASFSSISILFVNATPNCSGNPSVITGMLQVSPACSSTVTVKLYLGDTVIATTTTGPNGGMFTLTPGSNLPAGNQSLTLQACCTGTSFCSNARMVDVSAACCGLPCCCQTW